MPRNKVSIGERIEAAKRCSEGKISKSEAARRLNVHESTIGEWVLLYNEKGAIGLQSLEHNKAYPEELKEAAAAANPDAHPLFHSDRGFRYTDRTFHHKLEKAGMTQSMSRVAHCIDNGPMEGFRGILKREQYYGKKFSDRETLVKMIENYIAYYNSERLQRNPGVLTPPEKHAQYYLAA